VTIAPYGGGFCGDILLGRFAAAHIDAMSTENLTELEAIVALPDPVLLAWIMGDSPVPRDLRSATLEALIAYRP
jgi:antitoxin CptB